jgi:hypothetical protein
MHMPACLLRCCLCTCIYPSSFAAGEPPLPELLDKGEDEWMDMINSVCQGILNCEEHQHLQRYACLSQQEREFVSACLEPLPHLRPTVADLVRQQDYYLDAAAASLFSLWQDDSRTWHP